MSMMCMASETSMLPAHANKVAAVKMMANKIFFTVECFMRLYDRQWSVFVESLTNKVSGAGAPKVRRVPTLAIKMAKPWPVLASA